MLREKVLARCGNAGAVAGPSERLDAKDGCLGAEAAVRKEAFVFVEHAQGEGRMTARKLAPRSIEVGKLLWQGIFRALLACITCLR